MTKVNPFILQKLRRGKDWSQDRLAEMAKVNKQTISRIERGQQDNTRENTTKRLARALGVEPDDLTRAALAPESSQTEPIRRRTQSSFGVSDATYFWTFDGGESMHYAKNKDVMRRLLAFELGRALQREPVP